MRVSEACLRADLWSGFTGVRPSSSSSSFVRIALALNQHTTLTWAGVEFFSAGGSRLRGTVESESGFDYGPSYVSPVPEPALFTSAAASLLSFVLFGRVLRNFRPKKLALVAGIIEQSCEA